MHKLLYHFRRNRTYATHERWGVFAGLLFLTLAVTAGGWLLLGKPAASASSIVVTKIDLTKDTLPIGDKPTGEVTITVANKETQTPAVGVWLGLRIEDAILRTPQFTYYDWYSPTPERLFFQTNDKGQLTLPLTSKIAGLVRYEIYAANPEMANDAKYQPLDSSFNVSYIDDASSSI